MDRYRQEFCNSVIALRSKREQPDLGTNGKDVAESRPEVTDE
jgi:hypothetical protein